MKSVKLLLMILSLAIVQPASAKHITITFKYKFTHADGGQTINTRLKVYVDDVVKGVSLEKMETEANHVSIQIESGTHKIRAVIESEFEGVWEEHTIANEYSIDCVYLNEMNFTKNLWIELEFDLQKGTIVKKELNKSGTFYTPF